MTAQETISSYLASQEKAMFDLLKKMVLIQSGSGNKQGVDQIANEMSEQLGRLGLVSTVHPQEKTGDLIEARTSKAQDEKGFLLLGHMDTAFEAFSDFNWFKEDDEKAYGPGVVDMKGGLIVGIYALAALKATGLLNKIPLTFICNPDEEMGSSSSKPIIIKTAQNSLAAFVLEAACPNGDVITKRKGRLTFSLVCEGAKGHAAYCGIQSASAIKELVHQIKNLYNLAELTPGLTVNVGQISGGTSPNVVADKAQANVDLRFIEKADQELFIKELEQLLLQNSVAGAATRIENQTYVPPMTQTEPINRLYKLVAQQGQKIGMNIGRDLRPGCSDANTVAKQKIPVLDGMGPIGGGFHSEREYMIKKSLPQRAQLLALSLLECWQKQKSDAFFTA